MGVKNSNKKLVYVAMSGGVDSSVAAALLKRRGFDVVGVFMKCWSNDSFECDSVHDQEDARRVAAKLNIPFYTFNFEEEYKEKVVDYMVKGYKKGITPNPDVMCNKEIKFGVFLERALRLGADYIATGHYVRLRRKPKTQNPKPKNFNYKLVQSKDENKDQSYFLWTLTQKQLKCCLFPIGDYMKSEVRQLAKKFGLATADKKDSQGVCFIGKLDFQEFLKEYLSVKEGAVLNSTGDFLGKHQGVHFFTIGQRHGLGISGKAPYYVADKSLKDNTLIVASGINNNLLYKKEIVADGANWIAGKKPELPLFCWARIRYRQPLQKCEIRIINNRGIKVLFKKNIWAVSPGQSIVFYKNREMLGGAVIR